MTSEFFTYNKAKVIQALRYHFITRPEIKVMMILVNVFAIVSAALFFFRKISPLAFLISSVLWFFLMIVFWFWLPRMIYRRSGTFKDRFQAILSSGEFRIDGLSSGCYTVTVHVGSESIELLPIEIGSPRDSGGP